MTYEELLGEIETRVEELGGIGKHAEPDGARRAYFMALETLEKVEAATRELRHMIRRVGNDIYRAE